MLPPMSQMTLLPGTEEDPSAPGFVYLMTDGMLIKPGFTRRRDVKQRSGELRARVICFWPGNRAGEKRLHAQLKPWHVGGEWFRLPDTGPMLTLLRSKVAQWGGDAGLEVFDHVIANNLRRAA